MMSQFPRWLFLLSYSLLPCFVGLLVVGGFTLLEGGGVGSWIMDEACLAVSDDPVSICTTCLKVVVSAWTKVVGDESVMSFGVSGWAEFRAALLLVQLMVI